MLDVSLRLERAGFTLDAGFQTPESGVTALFGHSGCGKTTLLRCIAGLEEQARGYVRIAGEVWQEDSRDHFIKPHHRPVGYVFQEDTLFPHLSVLHNLNYADRRVSGRRRGLSMERAISVTGIGSLLARRPERLSGGERRRVAIARALLTGPRLMLLDEPLSGLDTESRRRLLMVLRTLRAELEIPLIFVSHQADEVARLADSVVMMHRGRVTAQGNLPDVFTDLDIAYDTGNDTISILTGEVDSFDERYGLTVLRVGGERFYLPTGPAVETGRRRLIIRANDISLVLNRPENTSILNIFPAVVDYIRPVDRARMLVRLRTGGGPLLARITRKSADRLQIAPGRRVFAQVKSVVLAD